tara:strand:+ start:247 stop:411 length:165 start_codon:yes stop_codon:yes gene_type:complete
MTLAFGVGNADALDKFKKDQDAGATWHQVDGQMPDPNAKSIAIDKIYYKLKKEK